MLKRNKIILSSLIIGGFSSLAYAKDEVLVCLACPVGTYSDGTKTSCTPCPANTYVNSQKHHAPHALQILMLIPLALPVSVV